MLNNLQEKAAAYLAAKTGRQYAILINEAQAGAIVRKLIAWYPIYKIFCTEPTGLGNLELLLAINPGLLDDEDFIYGVAAFYSTKENHYGNKIN